MKIRTNWVCHWVLSVDWGKELSCRYICIAKEVLGAQSVCRCCNTTEREVSPACLVWAYRFCYSRISVEVDDWVSGYGLQEKAVGTKVLQLNVKKKVRSMVKYFLNKPALVTHYTRDAEHNLLLFLLPTLSASSTFLTRCVPTLLNHKDHASLLIMLP